ncbi:McrB family protein [Acinetobacter johnsonii]|uniref:McrB family protein n=1 Tax=Acinetobacter johnsonii TaxID=40214 RepID=UPI0032B43A8C
MELFLLESKPESQRVDGISFSEILNGDYQKAVSYIQAHLVSKDILYPRHIIENYLTLLKTKDLIILAGDSGSGKTNLVKSFAKAVGGKSIIVPVKPNWTSSEDLLGYYNPLEKKYLATPFLEAMIEAQQNPEIPYFICLDEMNLARVEYYFADFLSLLETRDEDPEISLYAEDESSHVLSELKAVVDIIQSTQDKYSQNGVVNFIELLKDEKLNSQLRLAFGFSDKDSLIKYHNEIRRMLSGVMTMPSSIKMPANVHIIGAINIDETTHYLSPKILDRAHIMRFESPLLSDWDEILSEVSDYEFDDISKPLIFNIDALGYRANYPKFDRENPFCKLFIELNKEFFHKLGIEFGMRTIRQGLNYLDLFQDVNSDYEMAINNFLLHKVLPKLTFDGNKHVGEQTKLELIERVFLERLKQQLPNHENYSEIFSSIHALENVVRNAKANDGIVNFWS